MVAWIIFSLGGLAFALGLVKIATVWLGRTPAADIRWDLLSALALVPVAALAVHPYLSGNLIGAGDSYHYALQVADAVSQARSGVLPILVGQSDYAFNGNIHTLRTAPYFTHLASLLDLATGRRLSFVVLQNLTVVVTSILAAWAAFYCVRQAGGRRPAAWLLAAIYVHSPAVMGPLAFNDMFATYMAAPWLVLCWQGMIGILRSRDDLQAQLLASGSLAMVWYAHPPLAAWITVPWVAVQAVRLLQAGGDPAQWRRLSFALLLLAGLGAYAGASLATLPLAPPPVIGFDSSTWSQLAKFLRLEFTPFGFTRGAGNIQLGWTLWLLFAIGGIHLLRLRSTASGALMVILVCYTVLLVPVPHVNSGLWRWVPDALAAQTNWPGQRLLPLLASGIVALTGIALATIAERRTIYRAACTVLLAGLAWSIAESTAVLRRDGVAQLPPGVQARLFSPDNLRLTRYSYALFEQTPAYFTHGWADPEFESRLLDATWDPLVDNAQAVRQSAGAVAMSPLPAAATIELPGPAEYLLEFAFANPQVQGEITIQGASIDRAYTLPLSGGVAGFGATPESAKTIPLRLNEPGPTPINLATSAAGVSFRLLPVDRARLPVRIHGQIPYTATVQAPAPGFLETPRMFLQGYAAAVNDQPAPVQKSPEGLALVPVPAGQSKVVLTYPGPPLLRAAWILSVVGFASGPWWWALALRHAAQEGAARNHSDAPNQSLFAALSRAFRRRPKVVLGATLLIAICIGLTVCLRNSMYLAGPKGAVRLTAWFPKRPANGSEPLLTLGQTGAADCIYVRYEGSGGIKIGLDHWAYGGPISETIPLRYDRVHVIEIIHGALQPQPWWRRFFPVAPGRDAAGAAFVIRFDGQTVLDSHQAFYRVPPRMFHAGTNPIGASVAAARFSGRLVKVEAIRPDSRND